MKAQHALQIRMQAESAALERLCQVIRVRGFELLEIAARRDGDLWVIDLLVQGRRTVTMLRAQLEKLHAVVQV